MTSHYDTNHDGLSMSTAEVVPPSTMVGSESYVQSEPYMQPAPVLHDAPSDSHALAVADHDEKGAAQEYHEAPEVRDLGWHEPPDRVPTPLVAGLSNDELWMLLRRFDKQMYHVKVTYEEPPGGLDLNRAEQEEFSPDKLRGNIERLYMTVIIGVLTAAKHIARLRSWREYKRTAAFCSVYFIAWLLDLLSVMYLTTLIALILYPPARSYLFPPAPLALVDSKTGGMQKPGAGMLGSHGSLTGAPENHEGEAVELEARNFVANLGLIGVSALSGKQSDEKNKKDEKGKLDKAMPDPASMAGSALASKAATDSGPPSVAHDKTKQPMEAAMWEKTRPVMTAMADLADGWERLANALSPTPPFPPNIARLRLVGVLVPILGVAVTIGSYAFVKALGFLVGAVFFGDPLISRGLDWLNRNIPDWPKYIELRRTLLKGVPTNAQLTLTLLRIGEANKAPLPPPPRGEGGPSLQPPALHGDDVPMDVSHEEVQDMIHPDDDHPNMQDDRAADNHKKHHHGKRALAFIKSTTRAGVSAVLGTDRLKAQAGSEHSKMRLGVVPDPQEALVSGPVDFKARLHGKKGHVYLKTSLTPPYLFFCNESSSGSVDPDPVFTVAVPDITELKKIGGLGWKAKMLVGWALERELADGLEIVDKEGHTYTLTAIPLRDELFNRLVAMGGQKWESW